jgi:hypothetical protein
MSLLACAVMGCGGDISPTQDEVADAAAAPATLCTLFAPGPPCRAVDVHEAYANFCRKGTFDGKIVAASAGARGEEPLYEIEASLRITDLMVARCRASVDDLVEDVAMPDLLQRNSIVLGRYDTNEAVRQLFATRARFWATVTEPLVLAAEYATDAGPITVVLITGDDGLAVYHAGEIADLLLRP